MTERYEEPHKLKRNVFIEKAKHQPLNKQQSVCSLGPYGEPVLMKQLLSKVHFSAHLCLCLGRIALYGGKALQYFAIGKSWVKSRHIVEMPESSKVVQKTLRRNAGTVLKI